MTDAERAALEASLTDAFTRGQLDAVASAAVHGYGGELFGFVHALVPDADVAGELFAASCEALWRELPSFTAQTSFRTWLYTLARRAIWRWLERDAALCRELSLDEEVSPSSPPAIRSAAAMQKEHGLRASLPIADQALLILRVDRRLSWNDLARVLYDGDPADGADLAREPARLRARFQRLKLHVREQARAAGLLDNE